MDGTTMTKRPVLWAKEAAARLFPGTMVAATIAIAAQFVSEHYGAPAMLMALLFGIALHFLSEEGRCVAGIQFSAKPVLRFGIALLGVRISAGLLADLGWQMIVLILAGVALTILFGAAAVRLIGRDWRFGLLTGGSVAICGASAAMAIAAVLPKHERSDQDLLFTVVGVTVLSTIAMIAYPVIGALFALDDQAAGVFLGGAIHDVAQVVGAGFSISDEAGETATLVKLMRVLLLAPVILAFTLLIRMTDGKSSRDGKRPPLIPLFVAGFLLLATVNSFGLIPTAISDVIGDISRWCLLVSIAAVGLKTSVRQMLTVGGGAISLIIAETLLICAVVLGGVFLLEG